MKNTLKIEELGMAAIAIYFMTTFHVGISQWWYIPLFFAPDIGMLGYLLGAKSGAFTYNLFHHKLIAIIIFISGLMFEIPWLELSGVILFAHSSFDRILGYGLKYPTSFHDTHLGFIGKAKPQGS